MLIQVVRGARQAHAPARNDATSHLLEITFAASPIAQGRLAPLGFADCGNEEVAGLNV